MKLLNYEKCHIMRLGTLKHTKYTLPCQIPVKWKDGAIDVLGIHIPDNIKITSTVNFNIKLKRLNKILQSWQGNKLTICGKTTLVNTLIVSQFTYLMLSLPTPAESFYKEFEQQIKIKIYMEWKER